jgi:hypothetical protein
MASLVDVGGLPNHVKDCVSVLSLQWENIRTSPVGIPYKKEFEEHLSFKISSPGTHRICGFNLFTWFSATPLSNPYLHVYLEIRNNTKGRVWVFYPSIFPIEFSAEKSELLWLSYWKFGSNDPAFDNGDEFSVSVFTDDPVVQIKRVGVRMLHEEEGTDDDRSSSNTSVFLKRN